MANMHRVQRRMIRNFAAGKWIYYIDKNQKEIRKIPNTKKSLDHFCAGEDCYDQETDQILTIFERYYNNVTKRLNALGNFGQYKTPLYSNEAVGDIFEIGDAEKMVWYMWVTHVRNKNFEAIIRRDEQSFSPELYKFSMTNEHLIKSIAKEFLPTIVRYEYDLCLGDDPVIVQDRSTLNVMTSSHAWLALNPHYLVRFEHADECPANFKTLELPNVNPVDSLVFNKFSLDQASDYVFGLPDTLKRIINFIDWDWKAFLNYAGKRYRIISYLLPRETVETLQQISGGTFQPFCV